jgi:hypothetical protein
MSDLSTQSWEFTPFDVGAGAGKGDEQRTFFSCGNRLYGLGRIIRQQIPMPAHIKQKQGSGVNEINSHGGH